MKAFILAGLLTLSASLSTATDLSFLPDQPPTKEERAKAVKAFEDYVAFYLKDKYKPFNLYPIGKYILHKMLADPTREFKMVIGAELDEIEDMYGAIFLDCFGRFAQFKLLTNEADADFLLAIEFHGATDSTTLKLIEMPSVSNQTLEVVTATGFALDGNDR